jgi:ABC-type transport system substrate-binding protein
MNRRTVLQGAAASAAAWTTLSIFGGVGSLAAPGSTQLRAARFQEGTTLPEGAAPLDQQVFRRASDPTFAKVLDFYEAVYERPILADLFSESLVQITKDFEIIPSAATEWSGSEDGKTWTFTLAQDRVWSDGNPVTARDWVKTFQYSADPEHAWDFTWFWRPVIKGYADAVDGKSSVEEIGVKQGANEYELVFETVDPAPYLPAMLLYSLPLSAAALESTGPLYNTNPDTAVSSGPFILDEWIPDQTITHKRNESYAGPKQVPFQKLIVKLAAPNTHFTLYEANQVDMVESPAPAEIQIMESDPDKSKEVYQGVGDFGCFYFFFDVMKAPFDNKLVRQAFSHVLDRAAIKQQILGRQGNEAYSFLAPGFPAANGEALQDIQKFDPEMGKQLLAEAGYADGEGFPKLTLQVRGGGNPVENSTTQAYASMLKEHLNVDVEVQVVDRKAFYDSMNAKPTEVLFGWVSYGMDYFDPSNMLGVWLSGGRHSWSNPDYDAKVKEATVFLGDAAERLAMFQEAERILVEDVPAVFTYFSTPIQLIKPYVAGEFLVADKNGIAAMHWPSYTTMSTVPEQAYIAEGAPTDRS